MIGGPAKIQKQNVLVGAAFRLRREAEGMYADYVPPAVSQLRSASFLFC